MRFFLLIGLVAMAFMTLPLAAQQIYEPARGTNTRADIADALRPHAEWALSAPVTFNFQQISTNGLVAFLRATAMRPGAEPIDMDRTPLVYRDGRDPSYLDGATLQALLVKSGRVWVVVHFEIGATEAWWSAPQYCEIWNRVLPFCGQ